MYRIATVRVAHPYDPATFATINAVDLTADHVLWPEQAADYELTALPVARMDPAERDLAARVCGALMAKGLGLSLAEWDALPVAERLAHLRDVETETHDIAPTSELLRIAKGPRGLHYVYRGAEKVAGGFVTVEEAETARAAL